MEDWIKELNYFLTMNRKDILKDSGKISHEEAMNHARKEYDKYKDRISLKPSNVELHYLESIKNLEMINTKNQLCLLGLTNWEKSPDGKILKSDVVIAKNYLNEKRN